MREDESIAVVYPARAIVTVNPMQPSASAIALRCGRISAVGDRESVTRGLELSATRFKVDESFADAVMIPGLIEAHSHVTTTGALYQLPAYLGAYDRPGPGGVLRGCSTREEALARLKSASAAAAGPVIAWGYDPALLEGMPPIGREELDAAVPDRPVVVLNMSGHALSLNSAALRDVGYDSGTDRQGVFKGPSGEPTGEVAELPAMLPVLAKYLSPSPEFLLDGITITADLAQRRGLTTISDLLTQTEAEVSAMASYARSETAKVRIAAYYSALSIEQQGLETGIAFVKQLIAGNDERFRIAGVKYVADGSIQIFTALLRNPPYYDGHPNGLFNLEEKGLVDRMSALHQAGLQLAIHTNGDGATDRVLDALDSVLARHPRPGHRHRLEHVQMLTPEQIGRMARLGLLANVFSKHIYYWGDFHRTVSLGPDRAAQMDPCASVMQGGVRFSLHSDAWVTPIDQLESIWTAVTRRTRSGFVLGADERISGAQALRAVTIDAAFLLGEDHDKGSLEPGKVADITVLDRPLDDRNPDSFREAEIVATIVGGRAIPVIR